MTGNEYQKLALRTANGMNYSKFDFIVNSALGLCGESGEFADLVKKCVFQNHEWDYEHLAKELGDVAWYLAIGCEAIGYDLETVMQMNIDKLKKRYPDGFETERSIHRKEGDI